MANETSTTLLSKETQKKIDQWVAKYPTDRKQSAVLPALHIAQAAHQGWLSKEMMNAVAEYLDLPYIAVYEVATFYSMYELKPIGKHKISLCTNVSCMLCGSAEVADHLQQKLGVGFGETTADGRYTLKEVECLGACIGAPAMQLDQQYHENLTPAKIDQILAELEANDGSK